MALLRRFINDCNGKFKVALRDAPGGRISAWLLWGDHVRVVETHGAHVRVKARGHDGWVPSDVLGDEGLLELYVVDVGQGDGVLMRTPDDKWHVIDAGVSNEQQMTKKGMANFVRWKFQDDLGRRKVQLRSVILSHPDFDHYGGLIDLLRGEVQRPVRRFDVEVEHLYHCGIGRFKDAPRLGAIVEGTVDEPPFDDYGIDGSGAFITELLDDQDSFASPARPFDATFGRFAELVGALDATVRRLDHTDTYLDGYGAGTDVAIRVLGPVTEVVDGTPGLRAFGSESKTRNGHSVVLRVDYGKMRALLTGDLNTESQRLLLSYHALEEFSVDVAKGCHHGSDDIDLRFVRAMKPRATVISSGDNEDYAHPRPRVLGASARYGREAKSVTGELLPPLLYSTELARSVRLSFATRVRDIRDDAVELDASDVEMTTTASRTRFEPLEALPVATDLIYGLINIRSDGERVICAYMREQGKDFDIRAFKAGVEPFL